MESSVASSSSSKKLKYTQVVYDVMEIDGNEAPVGVFVTDGKANEDGISEANEKVFNKTWDNLVQDDFFQDLVVPPTAADSHLVNDITHTPSIESGNGSEETDNLNDESSYYDSDGLYAEDFTSYDETLILQAQFDAADLPPGVEASIPWLVEPTSCQTKLAATSSQTKIVATSSQTKLAATSSQTKIVATSSQTKLAATSSQAKLAATSSSRVPSSLSYNQGGQEEEDNEVLKKFRVFKKFDTVEDFSDHHFCNNPSKATQRSLDWTKTIHHDWTLLQQDLPDTIFVRVYEERMDLLRAVIVGAAGTPYHDGLFFFDLCFLPDYPKVPPQVHYFSFGFRLNPNLYNCGKVCLSLLNTWPGRSTEQWTPGKSTVLQVLLSIQALVLNEKPFFNEPGYDCLAGGKEGDNRSKTYNEDTFVLSCKTMLFTLRNPPKHFEDFVVGHFRERAQTILEACKAYLKGIQVGHPVDTEVKPVEDPEKSSLSFKKSLGIIVGSLVPAFIENGAKDCEQFIPLGDVTRSAPLKC